MMPMSSNQSLPESQVLGAFFQQFASVRVMGRATFKISCALREFGLKAIERKVVGLLLELSACESMDSTILGIIAMLGLEGRGQTELIVVNASPLVRGQIEGVGLGKLCRFTEESSGEVTWTNLCKAVAGSVNMADIAETVLEAHQTLMELDPENIPKFKDVVELLGAEVKDKCDLAKENKEIK
jgi:anti-anti-sigma regulatory factor